MPLERRPYGQTGENVTVIGLGGVFLNKHSFNDGVATVHRALELGIRYFDTSPAYGRGMSQAIVGEALDGRSEQYVLATKLNMRAPARSRSYDALRAQLDENLRLLRRDRVDTLQVHESDQHPWWTDAPQDQGGKPLDPDYDYAGSPVMRVLRDAKAEGLCRFTGITGNSADGVARALGNVDVDICLTTLNYDVLRRRARRELIPLAKAKNVTVILGGIFRVLNIFDNITEWLASPPSGTTRELRDSVECLYIGPARLRPFVGGAHDTLPARRSRRHRHTGGRGEACRDRGKRRGGREGPATCRPARRH